MGSRAEDARFGPVPETMPAEANAYGWFVVFALTLIYVIYSMDRMAFAILAPFIKRELLLSDSQLGILIGLAYSIPFALAGIPLARWADRSGRVRIIATAIGVWSLMTSLSGAAHTFWHMLLARIGVGSGEAGCLPPSHSIMADYIPRQGRPMAFGLHQLGGSVGAMLGMALAGWLATLLGWRSAFFILGGIGIVFSLLFLATVREPERGRLDAETKSAAELGEPILAVFAQILENKVYALLFAFVILNSFSFFGIQQWWPSFYTRTHDMSLVSIGVGLGTALAMGTIVGTVSGGLIATRVGRAHPRLPLYISSAAVVAAMVAMIASLLVSSATVSISLVTLVTFLWGLPAAVVLATKVTVTPSAIRATAAAITMTLVSILGLGLGPSFIGFLSDFLAPAYGADSLRMAMLASLSVMPVSAYLLFAAGRAHTTSRPKPIEARGARFDAGR